MAFPVHLGGPAQYRFRIARELCQAATAIPIRRLLQGPRRPTWGWLLELGTEVLRKHLATALAMADVDDARRYLDAFALDYPVESRVEITAEVQKTFRGDWFTPEQPKANRTILYFHGGGYSFYPKAYSGFIALIASTTQCRTFALDYRLSPEYRFPSQLEDALAAYRWLLQIGCRPEDIALVGDSAGGHLALTLLLSLRDSKMPMPACAAVLSPATDFVTEYPGITANEPFDWINARMVTRWAAWFCDDVERCHVLVSPVQADLRGLPPIYVQAGEAEILFDSIQAFSERARKQGIDIDLESWRDMNHVFQMFGPDVPQSATALRRLAEVIDLRLHASQKAATLFNASS